MMAALIKIHKKLETGMKNKSTKTLAITGIVAAVSLVASKFIMADAPPPKRVEPVIYPVTPVYTLAPGSWSNLSGYR
jgi:hypothetical protein